VEQYVAVGAAIRVAAGKSATSVPHGIEPGHRNIGEALLNDCSPCSSRICRSGPCR
jgi:hypothetical protein